LFGGWGFRTTERALVEISRTCDVPIVPLRLVDPRFYHLDTCLMPLDDRRALAFRPAFDTESWKVVEACFERIVGAPEHEAVEGLACNVHCPDGKTVVIEASCVATARALAAEGFAVRPIETSEFLKAGGSVFCMTLMI
jgi:N-dimethylarginine dimethylaminohydrolase